MTRERLETGADGAMQVGGWTRYLLGAESESNGLADWVQTDRRATFARDCFAAHYGLDAANPESTPQAQSDLALAGEVSAAYQGDAWACGILSVAAARASGLPGVGQDDDVVAKRAFAPASKAADTQRVSQALAKAAEQVAEADEAVRWQLGRAAGKSDEGATQAHVRLSPELREQMLANKQLRRICTLAGRMHAAGVSRLRRKSSDARSEYSGLTLGGLEDLGRVLPSELVYAADEMGELLLARKLLERQALTYETEGEIDQEKGPIVILLDNSGSMETDDGCLIEWAHAAALALATQAAAEKRRCVVVPFGWEPYESIERPTENLSWVGVNQGGGTDFGNALSAANQLITTKEPFKTADVVLITDGQDEGYSRQVDLLTGAGIELLAVLVGAAASGTEVYGAARTVRVHEQSINEAASLFCEE